jgi:hypothetical protein
MMRRTQMNMRITVKKEIVGVGEIENLQHENLVDWLGLKWIDFVGVGGVGGEGREL